MDRVRICSVVAALFAAPLFAQKPAAEDLFRDTERKSGGTVFFRGSVAWFPDDRSNEVFTDTLASAGKNDDNTGWAVGAGVDLDLSQKLVYGDLLGEVFVEYAEFSTKRVLQTTNALLGGSKTSRVTINQLSVVVAPKLRWECGPVRPWVIPVGPAFLVNSPPSDDTTVLDIGLHFGVGLECLILKPFSIGVDARYTVGFGRSDTDTDYLSLGGYVGIDF